MKWKAQTSQSQRKRKKEEKYIWHNFTANELHCGGHNSTANNLHCRACFCLRQLHYCRVTSFCKVLSKFLTHASPICIDPDALKLSSTHYITLYSRDCTGIFFSPCTVWDVINFCPYFQLFICHPYFQLFICHPESRNLGRKFEANLNFKFQASFIVRSQLTAQPFYFKDALASKHHRKSKGWHDRLPLPHETPKPNAALTAWVTGIWVK